MNEYIGLCDGKIFRQVTEYLELIKRRENRVTGPDSSISMGDGVSHGSLLLWGTFSTSAITCWFFLPHVFPGQCVTMDDLSLQLSPCGSAWLSPCPTRSWRLEEWTRWSLRYPSGLTFIALRSPGLLLWPFTATELENREANVWPQVDQIFQCLHFSVSVWVTCVRKRWAACIQFKWSGEFCDDILIHLGDRICQNKGKRHLLLNHVFGSEDGASVMEYSPGLHLLLWL